MKGVHRFGVKGKLAPCYIGPFRIIQQCGPVAYQLELPPHLSSTHDVFHVSQLKKCLRVPSEAETHHVNDRCGDRKSTRLNSSHTVISYAVFCLKKKKKNI